MLGPGAGLRWSLSPSSAAHGLVCSPGLWMAAAVTHLSSLHSGPVLIQGQHVLCWWQVSPRCPPPSVVETSGCYRDALCSHCLPICGLCLQIPLRLPSDSQDLMWSQYPSPFCCYKNATYGTISGQGSVLLAYNLRAKPSRWRRKAWRSGRQLVTGLIIRNQKNGSCCSGVFSILYSSWDTTIHS